MPGKFFGQVVTNRHLNVCSGCAALASLVVVSAAPPQPATIPITLNTNTIRRHMVSYSFGSSFAMAAMSHLIPCPSNATCTRACGPVPS